VLEDTQQYSTDWAANTAESNVNYTDPDNANTIELATTDIPDISQSTYDAGLTLLQSDGTGPGSSGIDSLVVQNVAWQSFQSTYSRSYILDTIIMYLNMAAGTEDYQVTMSIHSAKTDSLDDTYLLSTEVIQNIVATSPSPTNFVFLSQDLTIVPDTTYWIRMYVLVASVDQFIANHCLIAYNSAGGYADGQMDYYNAVTSTPVTDIGDAKFAISQSGDYYETSGYLTSQIIDLGETPTEIGEMKFIDSTPSVYGTTAIVYNLYGSTDNFVSSNVDIGIFEDGDPILTDDWYRYYKIKATLSTTDAAETPIVFSMTISYVTFIYVSDNTFLGYEPVVHKLSSLTTQIDDFNLTPIGQLTITLKQSSNLKTYIDESYPKLKPAKVFHGYIADGYTIDDYLTFYTGLIDDWQFRDYDLVITLKDANVSWNIDLPIDETASEGNAAAGTYTPLTFSADHHVEAMLTILQDGIPVRKSTLDSGSFSQVQAIIPDYEVTRTIDETEPQKASDLLNELRILIGAYFIPRENGKIFLKLYDSSELSTELITDDDILGNPTYYSNTKTLINKTFVNYNYSSGSPLDIWVGLDDTSISTYKTTMQWTFDDYWTLDNAQGQIQQGDLATRIIQRYAGPLPKFEFSLDRKHIEKTVGDMIWISTRQAPTIDPQKYQIIKKDINLTRDNQKIDFTALRVYDEPGRNWTTDEIWDLSGSLTIIHCMIHIGNGVILAGTGNNSDLLRLTDYGNSQAIIARLSYPGDKIASLKKLNSGVILAGLYNVSYIYRSTDSGISWGPGQDLGESTIVKYFEEYGGYVTAITLNGKAFVSNDDGISWSTSNVIKSSSTAECIFANDNGRLFCPVRDGSSLDLYYSDDHGYTWTSLTTLVAGSIYGNAGVNFGGGILLVGASNGYLYKSTDDGDTWDSGTDLSPITIIQCIELINDTTAVIGGTDNGTPAKAYIAITEDSCSTYESLGNQIDELQVTEMVYCGYSVTLAVCGGSRIYRSTG